MGRGVRHVARLTRPQVQEQVVASSGDPPDYEGRITLDCTLLDVERLVGALEAGGFKLSNSWIHQNLVLHHIGQSMHRSAVLLHKLCRMAGSLYRPTDHCEISWQDLQWVEIQWNAGEIPVHEEIMEDENGVLSSVILPDPVPVHVMEESSDEGSASSANN